MYTRQWREKREGRGEERGVWGEEKGEVGEKRKEQSLSVYEHVVWRMIVRMCKTYMKKMKRKMKRKWKRETNEYLSFKYSTSLSTSLYHSQSLSPNCTSKGIRLLSSEPESFSLLAPSPFRRLRSSNRGSLAKMPPESRFAPFSLCPLLFSHVKTGASNELNTLMKRVFND